MLFQFGGNVSCFEHAISVKGYSGSFVKMDVSALLATE